MVTNSRTTSLTGLFHTGAKSFKTLCRLHWRPLLVLLVAGFFLYAPIGEAVAQTQLPVPYLSTGYRFLVVPFGGGAGFEQPGFNDSHFSIGAAGFGSGGFCPLDPTVKTFWPLNTDLLLRKTFALPANAANVRVGVAIDNDVQVFINGVDISGGLRSSEGCAVRDRFIFPIPDSLLVFGGDNLLAVRARDRGVIGYVDVEVRADILPICGNGIREGNEECDDGNAVSGDGCSATCQNEICTALPSDLVSWWPLDATSGTTMDDIMGGKTGTVTGTTSVAGKVSNGRRFVPGDVMVADGSGVLDITGNQVTIDAWIRLENNPTTAQTFTGFVGKLAFPDKQSYLIVFESGPIAGGPLGTLPQNMWRFEYILTNSAGTRVHNQGTGIDVTVDGQYHHFAMTYDGADVRLYVDGVLKKTFSFSGNLKSIPTEPVRIGSGAPFAIDEVEIFDRALTGSEIQAIFAAGSAGKCEPVCGNAIKEATEECDDGNAVSGDGCSAICQNEICTAPPSGLVSWWPGDGNANDIANANDGTLVNGATFVPGKVGQAFGLDGSGDAMLIGNPSSLQLQTFTIDAWIKRASTARVSFDAGGGGILVYGQNGYGLGLLDDGRLFLTKVGVSNVDSGSLRVTDTRFHHVAVTKSSSTVVFYVDGVASAAPAYDPGFTFTANAAIGARGDTFGNSFLGIIDEVEVFNRALSAPEIQVIFNAGSAGKCKVPVANAGPDQTVNEGALVTLDGSGSSDPLGKRLTFQWTQIAGPPVTLNLTDPVHPTFTAPTVPAGGATLTFQLTVTDGEQTSAPDTVNITVKNVNRVPVADAGAEQTVNEGSLVTLDGSNSFDPDGESLTFNWVQTAGPTVSLSDPTAVKPSFTAPLVGPAGATLTFELTVSDGIAIATDAVNVFVENVNHPPIANAGADQTKKEGTLVTLDGTQSSDPDNDALTYTWTQISGPPVTLSDSHSPTPSFTAPLVGPGGATLVFQLVVNDGLANSLPDEVTITVLNVNDPPVCGLGQASPNRLWPPNHKLISVAIVGVTDPNNDGVTITITGVTQDEPVNGLGDGDTSPDAVIQGSTVLLRAERSGTGNGRLYQVNFTADDGQGGMCTGAVTVGVPHSMKPGTSAVDDGQLYDSTQP